MTEPEFSPQWRALQPACPAGGRDCPDGDTLAALAAGTLAPSRRDEVLDRVAQCAGCADALRLAMAAEEYAQSLAAAVTQDAAAPARALSRRRRRWGVAFAMAASVLVAIGVGGVLLQPPPPDAVRGGLVAAIEPADGARLAVAPARLAWGCAQPAAVRVEILDVAAHAVWQGTSSECALALPQSAQAALGPGDWWWQVRAPDGSVVAGPWSFRIE